MNKKMFLIGISLLLICLNIFITTESCICQYNYLKSQVNKSKYKDIYSYNYTIINNLATGYSIIEFSLDVSRKYNTTMLDTIGLSFSDVYTENTVRRSYNTLALYDLITPISFSKLPKGWDGDLYNDKFAYWINSNLLPPDSIASGFAIESKGIPSIRLATIVPFLDVEQFPSMDNLNTLEEADSLMIYIDSLREASIIYTITIGPTNPPFPFNSSHFIDTIKSYTNQSFELGWITNEQTKNKYIKMFDSAKYLLQIDTSGKLSRNILLNVLQNANQDSSSTLTSEAYALIYFNTEYLINNLPGVITLTSYIDSSWNMISIPVNPPNFSKSEIYPNSVSSAYIFKPDTGYVATNQLENGIGFWLKFNKRDTVNYRGFVIEKETINVKTGWNLIGTISTVLDTNKFQSLPQGIMLSKFYGFSKNLGYFITNKLYPGKAYWIKVSQPGKLILDKYSLSGGGQGSEPLPPPPPGAPEVPELYLPVNGSSSISRTPTLHWYESNNAQSYRLQLSTNSNFTSIVYDDSTITTTSKTVGPLSNGTTHYWRVRAKNDIWTSYWSPVWYFRTQGSQPDPCEPIEALTATDEIIITDANGNSQKLYMYNGGRRIALGLKDYEMPPEPVEGIFHARFHSNKFIENIPPGKGIIKIPIKIKSAKYPVEIFWNIKSESKTKYWLYKTKNQKIEILGNNKIKINNIENDTLNIDAQALLPGPCY